MLVLHYLEKGKKKKKRASDSAGSHKLAPADMGLHPHPAQDGCWDRGGDQGLKGA